MSSYTEANNPLFLQPVNPNEPEQAEPVAQAAQVGPYDYNSIFSGRP
ncbi:hypothetical protein ACIBED_15340 [Rhodococcus coprophilus]|uniref:Uncharacterized protein n=1 Tax=Rhodococcus coprophilus TaxID=38310 RepID=A0A2X4TSM0_9NOCA|nr:hypothetical protein [Rhodococcus coprophilus]MBM7457814.1 hypothetical protein [Rhodococcus coprophilus]SQI30437.1 Uncharacterised protein [Rhodococcus coprophilus]